jgi:hypothetical protein
MKVKLPKFNCLRCGHKWNPRNEQEPLRCAFCKSPYWNKAPNPGLVRAPKHDEECVGCRDKK